MRLWSHKIASHLLAQFVECCGPYLFRGGRWSCCGEKKRHSGFLCCSRVLFTKEIFVGLAHAVKRDNASLPEKGRGPIRRFQSRENMAHEEMESKPSFALHFLMCHVCLQAGRSGRPAEDARKHLLKQWLRTGRESPGAPCHKAIRPDQHCPLR